MKPMKVIRILDEYSLLISGGREADLREGDHVEVFQPGELIIDPDTQENLGALDTRKAKLVVIQVLDRMAIAETVETRHIRTSNLYSIFEALQGERTELKPLNIDPNEVETDNHKVDLRIRVGDPVRKLDD